MFQPDPIATRLPYLHDRYDEAAHPDLVAAGRTGILQARREGLLRPDGAHDLTEALRAEDATVETAMVGIFAGFMADLAASAAAIAPVRAAVDALTRAVHDAAPGPGTGGQTLEGLVRPADVVILRDPTPTADPVDPLYHPALVEMIYQIATAVEECWPQGQPPHPTDLAARACARSSHPDLAVAFLAAGIDQSLQISSWGEDEDTMADWLSQHPLPAVAETADAAAQPRHDTTVTQLLTVLDRHGADLDQLLIAGAHVLDELRAPTAPGL